MHGKRKWKGGGALVDAGNGLGRRLGQEVRKMGRCKIMLRFESKYNVMLASPWNMG